jgi:CRISPR-associated protein Cas1
MVNSLVGSVGAAPQVEVPPAEDEPPVRVMALHALQYCERLFYLEEVEEIRVADAAVFAGRDLHELLSDEDESGTEHRSFDVASERLGLVGKVDAFRRRDGAWTAYEHKRGRCARGHGGGSAAWDTDRIQVAAYAMLLEEATGERIPEGRVRYHESGVTVRVPIDDDLRDQVEQTIARARALRSSPRRPPVATNPRLCLRCSLAPVCLPEEERLARDPDWAPLRLFPEDVERQTLHITAHDARVGRSGDSLMVERKDQPKQRFPIRDVHALVVNGYGQVTTAAIHLCAAHEVAIHWLSPGGRYVAGTGDGGAAVQRRIRQYEALSDGRFALTLARRLAAARIESQIRYVLRATRGVAMDRGRIAGQIGLMRQQLRSAVRATTVEALRGYEGAAGRAYYEALPALLGADVDDRLRPDGRRATASTRR